MSRYPNGLPSGYPHAFYGKEIANKAAVTASSILDAVTEHYRANNDTDIVTGTTEG
ncbi:MAG: hypothetical protein GWN37_14180 [Gammaproteobacteria bacterium]|nr:hypothetical protein [Gammaproteobacteria bacterium]